MADGRGGARTPAKPAAVSGPGKFAKRTDGGVSQPIRDVTGGSYGENTEMRTLQSDAPMNASGRMSQGQMAPQIPAQPKPIVPFDAPSQNPDEPVTAGNPMGPGPGAPMLAAPEVPDRQHLQVWLPVLQKMAKDPQSSEMMRRFVRKIQGIAG